MWSELKDKDVEEILLMMYSSTGKFTGMQTNLAITPCCAAHGHTHLCSFKVCKPDLMSLQVSLVLPGQMADKAVTTSDGKVRRLDFTVANKTQNNFSSVRKMVTKNSPPRLVDCIIDG